MVHGFVSNVFNLKGNADPEKGTATAATGKGGQFEPGFNERYHYILKRNNARVSNATTLCLLITGLFTRNELQL